MLILPTSFNHLSESYFLCHLKHSFLKAMFRWCQAQNTHKSSVRPNTLKILFFFFAEMWGGSRRRILQSFFFQSFRSKYIYNHPSGKKCLYREKFYEEMWVNRLNDASNLYGIRRVSKCAFSHSLWHLRWLQKSIPHLLVVVQWMHTIHKVLNTIRIMLSYDVPLI